MMMNNRIIEESAGEKAYHYVPNAEFTGVYDKFVLRNTTNIRDYHLFMRYGDKVYMVVKGVGDIVLSYYDLQKNKYWKYYYDLSLMLTNNKHFIIEDNKDYRWYIDSAFIEFCVIDKINRVSNYEYACYFKISPYDLEDMNYASPKNVNVFIEKYMKRCDIKYNTFGDICCLFNNLVIDYHATKMENELDELTAFFDDKKNIVDLIALNDKHKMNIDVLMIIYKNLVGTDKANKNMLHILAKVEEEGALELTRQIVAF
jgi:hypothetical protein